MATSNVWDAVLDPVAGGGCSTLDLLKRIPYANASEPSPHVPEPVRQEMRAIAIAKQQQRDQRSKRSHANNQPQQVANMATLGELLDRPRQKYVPGTPVARKLKGGRLLRTDGRDDQLLFSSRSAPTLATMHHTVTSTHSGVADLDTLDQAVHLHTTAAAPSPVPASRVAVVEMEDPHTAQLREQRQHLEQRLLHVTQKLCRKYTRQLFPRPAHGGSPDKMGALADKWAHSDALSESEKYALYMGSRFSTQQQRDFYTRELEPREPERDRHRRETQHSKYGNALVKSKHSLRANF